MGINAVQKKIIFTVGRFKKVIAISIQLLSKNEINEVLISQIVWVCEWARESESIDFYSLYFIYKVRDKAIINSVDIERGCEKKNEKYLLFAINLYPTLKYTRKSIK